MEDHRSNVPWTEIKDLRGKKIKPQKEYVESAPIIAHGLYLALLMFYTISKHFWGPCGPHIYSRVFFKYSFQEKLKKQKQHKNSFSKWPSIMTV